MSTPRTLKSALEAGYVICKLYAKYDKKIRVTVQERFHQADRKMFLDFGLTESISSVIILIHTTDYENIFCTSRNKV